MTTLQKCGACGAEWSTGSRFCPKCDALIGATERPNRPVTTRSLVPDYLALALFSILFFWPTGMAATWHASRANEAAARGAEELAQELAAKSRTYWVISFVVPFALFLALAIRGLGS
jgi:hypothetical protein